jgi:hypothetical protein
MSSVFLSVKLLAPPIRISSVDELNFTFKNMIMLATDKTTPFLKIENFNFLKTFFSFLI